MGYVNPYFIDNMGRHMGEVYGAVTDQILINLARYFPYYKPGQPVPQSAFEYQANMLAEMGQVTQETIKIIRNGLSDADGALQDVLQQAIMESVKKAQPDLLKAVQQGLLNPTKRPVLSPNQMTAYWTYYQQAADKLNLVNTVMLESTRQAYQSTVADITNRIMATQTALDVGTGEVVTGVSSWNQATMHAINRMKTNGITGFIDHGNHHWSAEAYVSMDIRTTVANTARAAVWETNQNFGNDLYLVSYHNGARPLCYPWQNKVISANDTAGVTYDLDGNEITVIAQSDTSYGEPAGLFGINCKHYPSPFIPGVSLIRGEPQSKEANDKAYEESQQQRALERKIREEKRDLMMLKAQNAPDEMIKAQRARIRQTDDDIDNFCAETGRHRRQNREAVYTKREFPDPKTYDVTTFERDQKEVIDKYFTNNGVQAQYNNTPGMTPKQNIATPHTAQTKPTTVEKNEQWYDSEIERLRNQRKALFDSDNYDHEETERLRKQIFKLEDEKAEYIVEKKFAPSAIAPKEMTPGTSEYNIMSKQGGFARITEEHSIYQDMKATNPDYAKDRAHKVNCQRCTYAYEARRRGWNVESGVQLGRNDEAFYYARYFPESFSHGVTDPSSLENIGLRRNEATLKEIKRRMSEYGDGSRGFVFCQWKNGGGHYFNVENMGGEIIFIDAQNGKYGADVEEYFKNMKPSDTAFMRSDDKTFTDVVLKQKVFEKGRKQ